MVAVPLSRPWVPITHSDITNTSAASRYGLAVDSGVTLSFRRSPAFIAGFGSWTWICIRWPARSISIAINPALGASDASTREGVVEHIDRSASQTAPPWHTAGTEAKASDTATQSWSSVLPATDRTLSPG